MKTQNSINTAKLEFAIFCIENIAAYLKKDADRIYKLLTDDSDLLTAYIIPEYAMLHTQSKEYIVNEIVEVMKEKGLIA